MHDALRGAGENEVAGHQGEVAGQVGNDLGGGEDHVGGVGVLAGLSVDLRGDGQVIGIDGVGGDQTGADGVNIFTFFIYSPLYFYYINKCVNINGNCVKACFRLCTGTVR